ncbi:MAG: DegT/DnrJ/EryC1/StrS family aminotransferase [Paludibacter sp.]|nr:DegT/DnrJ/EryC1/StrS family aminotransferase [Paludibacter sp.]
MMESIQMVDLKSQYQKIKSEVDTGIRDVIDSTAFIKGGKVAEFQSHLEEYLQVKHVIPVGNGTDALQIALMSLGLQPGDEVIAPTFTFIATAEVIALLQLTPVLIDVDPDTYTLTADLVSKAITPKTKAIIPVHLFGQNAPMEEILQLAAQHNIYVIEDACQSIGARYRFANGERVQSGCMGHIGCTSFFPSKNLGCYGDGGALFTNDDTLAKRIRSIANHGMETRYYHDHIGVNSRLDSIQAAVLDVKLTHLDSYINARQHAAAFYDEAFSNHPKLQVPQRTSYSEHVFHQYTLRLKGVDRTALQSYLSEQGVPSMIYYPVNVHQQKAYRSNRYRDGDFPVAEELSQTVLSLPMHTELAVEQLTHITNSVLSFL